jgi:hypothetical protein
MPLAGFVGLYGRAFNNLAGPMSDEWIENGSIYLILVALISPMMMPLPLSLSVAELPKLFQLKCPSHA